MGIFDSVSFSPSGYGGLLGDLLSRLQFQQPQPSLGFADGQGSYGGVNYPIFGQPDQAAAIPPAAQPAQYQAQSQPIAPQAPPQYYQPQQGGFGSAFRGAMANAHTGPLGLILGGIAGAAGMGSGDPEQLLYGALIKSGVPDAVARAAVVDKEVLKTIAPQIYTKPKFTQTGESPLGKQFGFVDEGKQTINGQPIGAGSGGSTSADFLAPGVRQENTSLTGDAYLSQYSPQIQAAVRAYINGDVLPSGNPRLAGIAQFAKTVAQKYGQDMGIPVSDSLYSEKRKYRTELGSNYAGSAGGQAKAFVQATEHLSSLADTLGNLKNWDLYLPFASSAANAARQQLSTGQKAIADKADSIGQTLAGEVGKLFSGTQGGGVREREDTRARFSTVRSPEQLAAALEATLDVMRGGLTALEGRRDQILGPGSNVTFIDDRTKNKIEHIESIIAKLKSGQDASSQQSGPVVPPGALKALQTDPSLAAQFDAKYGKGAAAKILGR